MGGHRTKTLWEMMVFLRFRKDVSAWDRRRALTMMQKALFDKCLKVHWKMVWVVAEMSLARRPMSAAHAIWLNTFGKLADEFDIQMEEGYHSDLREM